MDSGDKPLHPPLSLRSLLRRMGARRWAISLLALQAGNVVLGSTHELSHALGIPGAWHGHSHESVAPVGLACPPPAGHFHDGQWHSHDAVAEARLVHTGMDSGLGEEAPASAPPPSPAAPPSPARAPQPASGHQHQFQLPTFVADAPVKSISEIAYVGPQPVAVLPAVLPTLRLFVFEFVYPQARDQRTPRPSLPARCVRGPPAA